MPCSREAATLRLIAFWVEQVIEDEDYALRVTLADVLQHVDLVSRTDSLREYDLDRRLELLARTNWEAERALRMIRQWLAPRSGGVQ